MEMTRLSSSQKGKKLELVKHHQNKWLFVINDGSNFIFEPINTIEKPFHLKNVTVDAIPSIFSKDELYLDSAFIKGDLHLREWKIGDRIQPVGMKGSKLISDIISDAKVTFLEKKDILVLHDDDVIHWCVGYAVGRCALAHKDSAEIIKCSVTYSTPQE
jgi:tRNA(Ile)-lysidine synthetase-like protein